MSAPPTVLVIEHEALCPPALVGDWLIEAGLRLEVCRPYVGDPLPALSGFQALLVLGGSMGATDDADAPWLPGTRDLIRDAAASGVPTWGICLGHQLITVALGGRIHRNPQGQQVGLLPIGWAAGQVADPLLGALAAQSQGEARGVHWNSDVVAELPAGAQVLATAPGGEVQAARFADAVWGVQWHPEVTEPIVRSWVLADVPTGVSAEHQVALDRIAAAHQELAVTWRPLARSFAARTVGAASAPDRGALRTPVA